MHITLIKYIGDITLYLKTKELSQFLKIKLSFQ